MKEDCRFLMNSDEISRLVPQIATITEFPDFIVAELQAGAQIPFVPGFAMRTRDFATLINKWGNTDFVFEWREIPYEMLYLGVSNERLSNYVNHPQMSIHEKETCSALWYANEGLFQNIVRDYTAMDGFMYDLNGDPVYRSFRVELGSNHYATGVHTMLLSNPKVNATLAVEKVPYYNQDSIGNFQVVFNYRPDAEEFYELYEIERKASFNLFKLTEAIVERLNLSQFKRNAESEKWTQQS